MNRFLVILSAVLALYLAGLWFAQSVVDAEFERQRWADSTFVGLPLPQGFAPASVARVEASGPMLGREWNYRRNGEGWRIREHHDAFAQPEALGNLLSALTSGRGVVVGHWGADRHFGLDPASAMRLRLFDESNRELAAILVGRDVPGMRSTEAYVRVGDNERVYQFQTRPRAVFAPGPAPGLPPLIDTSIIPKALRRPGIKRIAMDNTEEAEDLREIERVEKPQDPDKPPMPDKGPAWEWYGVFAGERGRVKLNFANASALVSGLAGLSSTRLAGDRAAFADAFRGGRVFRLTYDDDAEDELEIGSSQASLKGQPVSCAATGQVFLLNEDEAKALHVDLGALLAPEPVAPPPPEDGESGEFPGGFPGAPDGGR